MPMPSTALESGRLQPADLCTCHDNNNNNYNNYNNYNNNNYNYYNNYYNNMPAEVTCRQLACQSAIRTSDRPFDLPPDPRSMQSCLSHCRRLLGRAAVSVAIISNDKLDCTAQPNACWQLAGLSLLGQFNRKMIDDRVQRLEMGSYAT